MAEATIREAIDTSLEGFRSVNTEIAKLYTGIEPRLASLEREVSKLAIQIAPMVREWEQNLVGRIMVLETEKIALNAKVATLEAQAAGTKTALIGVLITAVFGLIGALWAIVMQYAIRD